MRCGRIALWLVALLAVGFIALAGYHYANRGRYQANAQLLEALQAVTLPVAEDKPLGEDGDWPQWRGPYRDGVARVKGLLSVWPLQGPPEVWKAKVGPGYSSSAVSADRLFTQFQDGASEVVLCLNAENGEEVWRRAYPCQYPVDPTYGPCPRSTPTVEDDRVYTVGGNGLLHCLDADSGKIRWQHDLPAEYGAKLPQWGVAFSTLIDGNLLITQPGGPSGGSVVAFDKRTGKEVWRAHDEPAGYSSPIAVTLAGRRQLLIFTGKSLVGLVPATGALLWRYPWPTSHDCNVATPIVRGDYVFISSSYGKGCALLRIAAQGEALSAEPVYEHNEMCNHFSSSVLVGEHIYGFSDQVLTCMDFRTGKVAWTKKGLGRGALLAADGKLIILGERGDLVLADAAPDGYRVQSTFRFSRQRCWSVPVLAQGRLYVRDDEKLVCFALKTP